MADLGCIATPGVLFAVLSPPPSTLVRLCQRSCNLLCVCVCMIIYTCVYIYPSGNCLYPPTSPCANTYLYTYIYIWSHYIEVPCRETGITHSEHVFILQDRFAPLLPNVGIIFHLFVPVCMPCRVCVRVTLYTFFVLGQKSLTVSASVHSLQKTHTESLFYFWEFLPSVEDLADRPDLGIK